MSVDAANGTPVEFVARLARAAELLVVQRFAVPGGWIYVTQTWLREDYKMSTAFVPEQERRVADNYEWVCGCNKKGSEHGSVLYFCKEHGPKGMPTDGGTLATPIHGVTRS